MITLPTQQRGDTMTVTVYTKDGCNPCRMTKIQMEKRGIAFNEINIADNDEAFQVVKDLGFAQVPVVQVFDETGKVVKQWSAFRADEIKELAESVSL